MNSTPDTAISDLEIVNRFAISLLQQKTLDDLLWSMAANLGEVLGFEDCVIYLRQGDELVQKAAFGVKNPDSRSIKNEIRIKVGDGIVGDVAQHGSIEYVSDLSGDSRYIHDEFSGQSELAVPLTFEGQVIGVLDSESSRENGFDQRDVDMLVSLANIAAPRIASALAQQELEKAELAMREAKQDADRANQAKTEFLSRMSHEIKTPLNAMLGFANLMKFEAGDKADPRIDKILLSGQHLLSLVNESLDVIRVEQNSIALDLQPVEVGEVLTDCIAMLQPESDRYGIDLELSAAAVVLQTDRQRLRQVLLNLISNAIKYNNMGGKVTVSAQEVDENGVELIVEDTGIGMAEDDLERLYEPFVRFGERRKSVDGHGIGMMISRQLVETLGGEIAVTSELGRGTRVCVRMPKRQQQSVA